MMEEKMRVIRKYYFLYILGAICLTYNAVSGMQNFWIQVGPNIQASGKVVEGERNECWIAASLKDPDFLIGISHAGRTDRTCPVIVSQDGGQTWRDVIFPGGNIGFDPLVQAGLDGTMYAMITGLDRKDVPHTRIWSTKDNGKTWLGPTEIYGFSFDHPRMAVDTSGSPFHGRLYYAWNQVSDTIETGQFNIYLHYSDDEGKSFIGPIHIDKILGGKPTMCDILVLSDGSLIIPYYPYVWPLDNKENEKKPVYLKTSFDAGQTFSERRKIIDIGASGWLDLRKDWPNEWALPIFAADVSEESPYKDHIYMVWDESTRTGNSSIWLIWSADKGKTWSEPVQVNDNLLASEKGPKDYRMTPVVAVNQEGIVGVAWYDRRDDPTRRCWNYYMAISLDGGQTFGENIRISSLPSCPGKNTAPSIRITNISPEQKEVKAEITKEKKEEKPKIPTLELSFDRSRNVWPGHYTGLTVDKKGRFHPLWADRRNDTQQLYTTIVEVLRKAPEFPELLEEIDITNRVRLVAGQATFDEEKGISIFELQLQNVSLEPLFAPLRLRVDTVEKGWNNLDSLEVLNADNKQRGIEAVWDYTSLMGTDKRLDPKEISEAKKIKIKTFIEAGLDGKIRFKVSGSIKRRT
jgi:hypothetical protein